MTIPTPLTEARVRTYSGYYAAGMQDSHNPKLKANTVGQYSEASGT